MKKTILTVTFILISLVFLIGGVLVAEYTSIPIGVKVLIVVICSALFSYSGGIPAAVIMTGYTMFFFSENNNFITFSGQNSQKLVVSILGIIVNTFFTAFSKEFFSFYLPLLHCDEMIYFGLPLISSYIRAT